MKLLAFSGDKKMIDTLFEVNVWVAIILAFLAGVLGILNWLIASSEEARRIGVPHRSPIPKWVSGAFGCWIVQFIAVMAVKLYYYYMS